MEEKIMAVEFPQPSAFRIGELFTDHRFLVPLYQRTYAWEQPEVDDFWRDLDAITNDERSSHFFGQVVTYNNRNKNVQEIIDGQQRLTTVSIFLAVLRDLAKKLLNEAGNDLDHGSQVQMWMLEEKVENLLTDSATQQPSLVVEEKSQQNSDTPIQKYFLALVHQDTPGASLSGIDLQSQPYKNLQGAYDILYNHLKKVVWHENTWTYRSQMLRRYLESFTQGFYVVLISALNQRDAFIIFETLNTRGKDLAAADIIKNFVMYVSRDRLEEANAQWKTMSNYLKGDSDRITRFIRTYWAARHALGCV
jgi:uncharacterized protein with ParB-like and HNH nuclease domain